MGGGMAMGVAQGAGPGAAGPGPGAGAGQPQMMTRMMVRPRGPGQQQPGLRQVGFRHRTRPSVGGLPSPLRLRIV